MCVTSVILPTLNLHHLHKHIPFQLTSPSSGSNFHDPHSLAFLLLLPTFPTLCYSAYPLWLSPGPASHLHIQGLGDRIYIPIALNANNVLTIPSLVIISTCQLNICILISQGLIKINTTKSKLLIQQPNPLNSFSL